MIILPGGGDMRGKRKAINLMPCTRRSFLSAALIFSYSPSIAQSEHIFTPEQFGAVGNGRADDGGAMSRLADAVNANGGGTIVFRQTTYLIGYQRAAAEGKYLFPPANLLKFSGCSRALRLQGNGARLLSAPRQRYGVFDQDGRPSTHAMPYYGDGIATPYVAMIEIENCTADIHVSNLELAGEINSLIVGGQYGDTGWQIGGTGLLLRNNSGSEFIDEIYTHHHPLDGIMIDGLDADVPNVSRIVRNIRAEVNGRQGCSIVGGRGYQFFNCRFSDTGRCNISSAPGAGVDIEAEGGKEIRNLAFRKCHFVNNRGVGMLAESGPSEDVKFENCIFIGTTNWSAWPSKARFQFEDCTFSGAVVRAYGDINPIKATGFIRCTFDDSLALSSYKRVYGGTNPNRPLADFDSAENVLFDHCIFLARHGSTLPWSTRAIYKDCVMTQNTNSTAYPRGQYIGTNHIIGKVDLQNSKINGMLTINGARMK